MPSLAYLWLESLKHYVLMCLLSSSPERLPYAPRATLVSIFAYFALGLLLVNEQHGVGAIGAQIGLEIAMLAGIAYLGLQLKGLLPRWHQTVSALIGINLVITAASLPLRGLLEPGDQGPGSLLLTLTLLLVVWNLAVLSMIFRRAFEISLQLSAMLAFVYFVVYQIVSIGFYT